MVNYLEILRLHHLGYSQRSMESATGSSRHTIREFIGRANDYHISWPLPEDVTNGVIEELLYAERKQKAASWREPDYAQIHSELARSGVTLTLLWSEYCARCHQENRTPYMYTQFCEKYRSWARVTKATMRITRKPGEVMEVDVNDIIIVDHSDNEKVYHVAETLYNGGNDMSKERGHGNRGGTLQ